MTAQELAALAEEIRAAGGHPASFVGPQRGDGTRLAVSGQSLSAYEYMKLLMLLREDAKASQRQLTPAAAKAIRLADESCEPQRKTRRRR